MVAALIPEVEETRVYLPENLCVNIRLYKKNMELCKGNIFFLKI